MSTPVSAVVQRFLVTAAMPVAMSKMIQKANTSTLPARLTS
jgi:hypothetical protein